MLARRNDVYAILFAVFVGGPITWWALDRQFPYEAIPLGTIPRVVHDGDSVEAEWQVKVFRTGCTGTFQRTVVDANMVVWAFQPYILTYTNQPVGDHIMRSATPFILPHGFAAGQATIYNHATAYCNPLHYLWPLHYSNPPMHFEVAN